MTKQLKKPDKLDKYRSHLMEGAELKEDELLMLAKYRKAHGLLCLGFSRNQVLATLEIEYELSQPQLYAIVRESTLLYGSIEEVDKKGQRVIAVENYKLLANLARKAGDIGNAIRATELGDKLQGLFEAEKSVLDPRAFLIPMPMDFSTDPAAYLAQVKADATEDTDYEDVTDRYMSNPNSSARRVYVNEKQRQFLAAKQRRRTFLGGRGSGKTTVAGHQTRVEMNYLPRAKVFLAGLTYTQLMSNTLPAMEAAWDVHGLREYDAKSGFGHYVKGKKPPTDWIKPYQPPSNYENVISFLNGYTIQLLSMDRAELARGGNYDGGHIDESALMKYEHVTKILSPMIRGNVHRFSHHLHHGFYDYTSVPWLPSGQWVFKTEDLAKQKPDEAFFLESTAYDNAIVLGEDYYPRLRNSMTQLEWDVEVLNKRLTKLPNSFYPSFNEEKHGVWKTYTYTHDDKTGLTLPLDGDRDPARALELSFDFNAGFTSVIVCQENGQEFRCLDALWVKQSQTTVLDALVTKFCDSYQGHECKHVVIYGDRNGNNKQVGANLTFYQTIQQGLAARGWTSVLMVQGLDPDHRLKHIAINELLAETNPRLPVLRLNRNKCQHLIISIQQSPINPDWTKNKNSEKSSIDQERATHLSDCFDNIVYRKYGHLFGQVQVHEPVYFLGRS